MHVTPTVSPQQPVAPKRPERLGPRRRTKSAADRKRWRPFRPPLIQLRRELSSSDQHDTHLLLFFDPSFSSSFNASGQGWTRCTGPLAMSATVWPSRFTFMTSAPFDTR